VLSSTIALFREHGHVRGEEQLDRKSAAKSAALIYQEKPVDTTDFEVITANTLLTPELSTAMFGEIDDEETEAEVYGVLRDLNQASGPVQDALENGLVLCSARITRRYEGGVTVKSTGRFVSSNPDVVERYFEQPSADRWVGGAATTKARFELAERRVPELAGRRQAIIAAAYEKMQLELPMPKDEDTQ
jgi:hypothetical protein